MFCLLHCFKRKKNAILKISLLPRTPMHFSSARYLAVRAVVMYRATVKSVMCVLTAATSSSKSCVDEC